jgi:NTP pyrophosphatase (non-canonical NTP hydrolase)
MPEEKHDRHACPTYKRTLSPCKDCLSAHGTDEPAPGPYTRPVPMCAESAVPEASKPTKKLAKKDAAAPSKERGVIGRIQEAMKFGDLGARSAILRSIAEERDRHKLMGFTVDYSFDKFCRIMAEELGEVAKAMDFAEATGLEDNIMTEAIQLASVAVSLCENIMIRKVSGQATAGFPEKP